MFFLFLRPASLLGKVCEMLCWIPLLFVVFTVNSVPTCVENDMYFVTLWPLLIASYACFDVSFVRTFLVPVMQYLYLHRTKLAVDFSACYFLCLVCSCS